MIYPEGHKLRPLPLTDDEIMWADLDPDVAHMFCRNCGEIDPYEPGGDCDDSSS